MKANDTLIFEMLIAGLQDKTSYKFGELLFWIGEQYDKNSKIISFDIAFDDNRNVATVFWSRQLIVFDNRYIHKVDEIRKFISLL